MNQREKLSKLSFQKVYLALLQKLERKGKSESTLLHILSWFSGFSKEDVLKWKESDYLYVDFFLSAPFLHPEREKIQGKICGVDIDSIEDALVKEVRRLDKCVDDVAKGKKKNACEFL